MYLHVAEVRIPVVWGRIEDKGDRLLVYSWFINIFWIVFFFVLFIAKSNVKVSGFIDRRL